MMRLLAPRRIAAQITALVILSAVIFHLCMSGAFLLNRISGFRPVARAAAARLDEAVAVVTATPPALRDTVIAAFAAAVPELDLRAGPPGEPGRRAITLADGTTVNVAARAGRGGPEPSIVLFSTIVFVALSTTLFVLWTLRSITAPLSRIAMAVDGFAPEGSPSDSLPPPLREDGPVEVAMLARGFNAMRERIVRMMADRTEMLAAVSHDLRTPITRLRLRAEFVPDAALRDLMLRDLKQMDALVHNALAFIRDRATARVPARLDLASLLRTVCDEATDLGARVRYEGPDHLVVEGHEDDLRRAVGNLIDNAAHVDAAVSVGLGQDEEGRIAITVEDDGPGIPPERLGEVMRPFRRGPDQEGRTGPSGFGLGLPIVHAIVAAHGGTLALTNLEPSGLRCAIALPAATPQAA